MFVLCELTYIDLQCCCYTSGKVEVMYNHTLLLLRLQRKAEACNIWLQYRGIISSSSSSHPLQTPSRHRFVEKQTLISDSIYFQVTLKIHERFFDYCVCIHIIHTHFSTHIVYTSLQLSYVKCKFSRQLTPYLNKIFTKQVHKCVIRSVN